jgi:GNAT superfamily N-acetyltransferase
MTDLMPTILSDLSTASLAIAAQANLHAFFGYLGRAPGVELVDRPESLRWYTGLGHPWYNGLLSRTAPGTEAGQEITAAQAYFQARGVPAFTWWLAPDVPREPWMALLRGHGFGYEAKTPGMAIQLRTLPVESRAPAGLEIVPVEDLEQLRIWNRTFVTGYPVPAEAEEALFQLLAGLGLAWPIRHYLGYLNGRPASTSSVFLGAGVAGVQFVATLPEARGQGLGAAMTLAPLRAARDLGYQAGILQSSEVGYKVYLRLGFVKVCEVDNFYWPAPEASTLSI